MGIDTAPRKDRQRRFSPLAILRSLLLVVAVITGLFTMHVIGQPLIHAESPSAAAGMGAHPQPHTAAPEHLLAAETGHALDDGCAGCPTGHDMNAASCVLALLALLLFLSPPRAISVAAPRDRVVWRMILPACPVPSIRPDLTALGISRT